MALLTTAQRKARFKALGLGEYNKANIKKFQKKAFPSHKEQWDGEYGLHTDRALRHFYNCSLVKNFEPTEFRCPCGRCTGYPSWMKQVELKHLQKIRNHYGKPMTITSGLRCSYENNRVGGVKGSGHTKGYAADFYMAGVTDTVANRTKALAYIKKLPNHEFTYGAHMKDSNGLYRDADGMGNAMHTETHKPKVAEKTKQQKAVDYAKKLAKDNSWHYVVWNGNDKKTQLCPICHKYPKGKYHGFNCIRFVFACWRHGGGIDCKCDGGLIHNSLGNKMLKASMADALKMAQKAIGCKDIKIIRNKNGIPQSKLKVGDACLNFSGSTYKHLFLYAGNGKMVDSGNWSNTAKQIAVRNAISCKIAIRYIGK